MEVFIVFIAIFVGFSIEGIVGFGSTAFAIPLLMSVVGLDQAVALMRLLSPWLAIYAIIRYREHIKLKVLLTILAYMAIGTPFGILLVTRLPARALKIILGAFIVLLGIKGLVPALDSIKVPKPTSKILLAISGIFQGAFSTGGPLAVYYARERLPDKSDFRNTMLCVWMTLNVAMLFVRGMGVLKGIGPLIATAFAAWAAGSLLGNFLHKKFTIKQFDRIVYIVFCVSGLFLLYQNIFL